MAEFVDVVRHGVDLCESHPESCRGCVIYDCLEYWHGDCPFEGWFGKTNLELLENKIERWTENRSRLKYPSWRDWWTSQFPGCENVPCPKRYFGAECKHITMHACDRCLDEEIPEDIAIKLKIEPINGRTD